MKNLIYAVEDDESIGELYKMTFEPLGHEIVVYDNAETMINELASRPCDIILMDLMLPGVDGIEAVKIIRREGKYNSIPIIIISAKGDEISKVKGLDAGADDYLSKPFSILELQARVKANLRKTTVVQRDNSSLTYEEISLNEAEHKCFVQGNEITVTLKEYNLLKLLLQNPERVVKREKILTEVWGYEYFGETRTLDMHVMSLRNKIAEHTKNQFIHTIRGVGYRFGKL